MRLGKVVALADQDGPSFYVVLEGVAQDAVLPISIGEMEARGRGRADDHPAATIRSVDCVASARDLDTCLAAWRNDAHWCASLVCISRCCKARSRPAQTKFIDSSF
jgi:hypothetical protein